jgi:5-methylcytosine-specific restriction endonuclease McrA
MNKNLRYEIYNKYEGHCSYCGKIIKFDEMQVDHLKPRRLNQINLNTFDNLMPSCRRCNHYKRAESLDNFRNMIKTLHQRIKDFYIVKVGIDFRLVEFKEWDGLFYFEKILNKEK